MNKIVLITGATSGIGLGCARKFAENGDKLILTGRNVSRLEEIKKELIGKGTEVLTLVFDVRDKKEAEKQMNALPSEWQKIDVLVNNAGLALGLEPEYEGNLDDWETMIDTNVKGLLTMTRLVVPGMVERNSGHIINVGSVAGDAAYAGGNVYCATKSAVKALSDGLRIDVANTSIRVTNLKPGLVETNFSTIRFHGDNDRAANVYKGIKPLTGDDIADVAFYAEQLNVSPRYLGQVTRQITGRSPKAIIDERIASEIETIITTTNKPLKDVARWLGFSSQAHLSRFFKKRRGVSPTEYQKHKQ